MPPANLHISINFWLLLLLLVGLIGGCVLVCRYLSRRRIHKVKQLEKRLADYKVKEARWLADREIWEQRQEHYRQFLSEASHEIATPLQTIQTDLDNMARISPVETGRWRQQLALIMEQVVRLSRLTNNLRLLAYFETPEAAIVRGSVNLKAVIEQVIISLGESADSHHVHVDYQCPLELALVLGDRDQLTQVFINLVDNGIKYAKSGGGQVLIAVSEGDTHLTIRVSDDGMGIAHKDLPHVFDTTYRAREAHHFRRQGSGLGLAIVKRIIEHHDGKIEASSQAGQGTTFTFDLPIYFPPSVTAS